jgi:F-type H+-transporting ATPase subunit gamma
MLARRSLSRITVQPSPLAAAPPNSRNMATLREIELRLKSVKNIEKITKVAFSSEVLGMSLIKMYSP